MSEAERGLWPSRFLPVQAGQRRGSRRAVRCLVVLLTAGCTGSPGTSPATGTATPTRPAGQRASGRDAVAALGPSSTGAGRPSDIPPPAPARPSGLRTPVPTVTTVTPAGPLPSPLTPSPGDLIRLRGTRDLNGQIEQDIAQLADGVVGHSYVLSAFCVADDPALTLRFGVWVLLEGSAGQSVPVAAAIPCDGRSHDFAYRSRYAGQLQLEAEAPDPGISAFQAMIRRSRAGTLRCASCDPTRISVRRRSFPTHRLASTSLRA